MVFGSRCRPRRGSLAGCTFAFSTPSRPSICFFSALGAGSFWRTWRPHSHDFFAESLFIGLPCGVLLTSETKKPARKKVKKIVSSLHAFSRHFHSSIMQSYTYSVG